jgi:hypothetical protein
MIVLVAAMLDGCSHAVDVRLLVVPSTTEKMRVPARKDFQIFQNVHIVRYSTHSPSYTGPGDSFFFASFQRVVPTNHHLSSTRLERQRAKEPR